MLLSYPDRHCVGFFLCRLVKPKPLLDFVKTQLEATNPAVKKAAVEILVTMRKQLGPDVRLRARLPEHWRELMQKIHLTEHSTGQAL